MNKVNEYVEKSYGIDKNFRYKENDPIINVLQQRINNAIE